MKTTVNFSDFVDGFQKIGRGNQFSCDGLKLIFDYLESEIEFDPIDICCTYTEYTLDEFNSDYETKFKTLQEIEDYVSSRSDTVGLTENSIIIKNY
mgnify:CR=1 FL=1